MTALRQRLLLAAALVAAGAVVLFGLRRPLVLTGMVTTDESIVGSEIPGRLEKLDVAPGDTVKRGQLLGAIAPAEGRADLAYSASLARSAADLVAQAEAALAAAQSSVTQAVADEELARLSFDRARSLQDRSVNSPQEFDQARAASDSARA